MFKIFKLPHNPLDFYKDHKIEFPILVRIYFVYQLCLRVWKNRLVQVEILLQNVEPICS